MDHTTYDQTVLSNLEIIGCYFIDNLYNRQYQIAKENFLTNSGAKSITDEYVGILSIYISAVKSKSHFENIVRGINSFYSKFTTLVMTNEYETINTILKQFIPQDYFVHLNSQMKQYFIEKILYETVEKIVNIFIKNEYLRKIIDDHENVSNIALLKSVIRNELVILREEYYGYFVKQLVNGGGGQGETVSSSKYETMRAEYENMALQLANSQKVIESLKGFSVNKGGELERAKKAVGVLSAELEKCKNEGRVRLSKLEGAHQREVNKLQAEIDELRAQLAEAREKAALAYKSGPSTTLAPVTSISKAPTHTSVSAFVKEDSPLSFDEPVEKSAPAPPKSVNRFMKKNTIIQKQEAKEEVQDDSQDEEYASSEDEESDVDSFDAFE